MKKNQDFLVAILLIVLIIFVWVLGFQFYLIKQKINNLSSTVVSQKSFQIISLSPTTNPSQVLNSELEKLDKVDINQINSVVAENETDLKNF